MTQKLKQNPQKQVELFNGEPWLTVRVGTDGIYRWATQKHGKMDTGTKKFLRDFMKRHGYKYSIMKVTKRIDD